MAVTLQLKLRPVRDYIQLPLGLVRELLAARDGKERLWEILVQTQAHPAAMHDRQWLETIVNYVPKGEALSLTRLAPWLKLAERVNRLDEAREGPFTLSDGQARLLWERITGEEFQLVALNPLFAEFLLEFAAAAGKHFSGLDDELMFDGPLLPDE